MKEKEKEQQEKKKREPVRPWLVDVSLDHLR